MRGPGAPPAGSPRARKTGRPAAPSGARPSAHRSPGAQWVCSAALPVVLGAAWRARLAPSAVSRARHRPGRDPDQAGRRLRPASVRLSGMESVPRPGLHRRPGSWAESAGRPRSPSAPWVGVQVQAGRARAAKAARAPISRGPGGGRPH